MTDYQYTIAIAILIIVLTFLFVRKFKRSLNVVLLIGLSDAGKTAIFSRIVFNKPKKSVTSLKENEASVVDLNIKLVDLPGAERLRSRLWEQYRTKVHNIFYVIDSTKVDSKLRDISEYLYRILADEIVHIKKTSFTIVCHKQDLEEAKSKSDIKSALEKELNAIKDTKRGQLGKTSEDEDSDYLVTKFDKKPISLDSLSVDLIETSINNLDQLIKTIL